MRSEYLLSMLVMMSLLFLSACNSDGDTIDGDNDLNDGDLSVVDGDDDIDTDGDDDTSDVDKDDADGDDSESDNETDGDEDPDLDNETAESETEIDGDDETDQEQPPTDSCDPNPCEDTNKTVCIDDGEGNAVCSCDAGFCDIDGTCVADGTENPDHSCSVCDSTANKDDWSVRAVSHECRASEGECDVAEYCDGVNLDCPADSFVADGIVCDDDSNACNGINTCVSGLCNETTSPVNCVASDECHLAGVCDTASGVCSNPAKADGTVCETGNQCVGGVCKECFDATGCSDYADDANPCTDIACVNNACVDVNDDSNVCTDDNPCTHSDLCSIGSCIGTPYSCDDGIVCTTDVCNGDGTCSYDILTDKCLINGSCYANRDNNPANECQWCSPDDSQTQWINKDSSHACSDDGLDCTSDICNGVGSCIHYTKVDKCLISGQCYESSDNNPTNDCQWCIPAYSNTSFTNKAKGVVCADDGLDCTSDTCSGSGSCAHDTKDDKCLIADQCYGSEEDNPANECQWCSPDDSQTQWIDKDSSHVCSDDGLDCTYDICNSGACSHYGRPDKCLIAGQCYESSDNNPANDCQWCIPAYSNTSFTNKAKGVVCADDGLDCTSDTCSGIGSCVHTTDIESCLIEGQCYALGEDNPANECSWCFSVSSQTNWTHKDGTHTCSDDGLFCTDDMCSGAGTCRHYTRPDSCLISGHCYYSEENNPVNECSICSPVYSRTSWSDKIAGIACTDDTNPCTYDYCNGSGACIHPDYDNNECDDGEDCTDNDICSSGVCSGNTYVCENSGTCNSDDDFCTCETGYTGDYCEDCAEGYIGYPNCIPEPGFVPIKVGNFWMGSPEECPGPVGYPGDCTREKGRDSDEVLHKVYLTYDFQMSRYETTEIQFEKLMGWNPIDTYDSDCAYGCGDNHPVKYISWYDTLAYANQLSLDEGLTPCYVLTNVVCENDGSVGSDYMNCFDEDSTYGGIESATVALEGGATRPQECEGYRLPTEAEWEYAIRAGSLTAFYTSEGNDGIITVPSCADSNMNQIGWYCGNSGYSTPEYGTKPMGGKEPNDWGLYDLSGNVWEWNWDWYQREYQDDVTTDPVGPTTGLYRVLHGGYWNGEAENCRSANRSSGNPPGNREYYLGFRLVRTSDWLSCYDSIQNGNETDVDCGGEICAPCASDKACIEMIDCESQNCAAGFCVAPTCEDNIQNGDETGVDCGGSCNVCIPEFVSIPAGSYIQGCVEDDTCYSNRTDVPRHTVNATAFEIMTNEVTNAQYIEYLNRNDNLCRSTTRCIDDNTEQYLVENDGVWSVRPGYEDHPVVFTTWYGAVNYCRMVGGRLPSEAEWEYVARGDISTMYYCGDEKDCMDEFAWHIVNSDDQTHPIAQKKPTHHGLYDLFGNAREWTADPYHGDYIGHPGTSNVWGRDGNDRYSMIRGGSYISEGMPITLSWRENRNPWNTYKDIGFRCARDAEATD